MMYNSNPLIDVMVTRKTEKKFIQPDQKLS